MATTTATAPTLFVYRKAERGWWAVEAPVFDVWSQGRTISSARANMVGALEDLLGTSPVVGRVVGEIKVERVVAELVE